jgi:hypothetical protein
MGAIFVVAIALGATVWEATSQSSNPVRSGEICVTVTMASSMGGGVEHACGAAARDWCRAAYVQHGAHAEAVQARCRAAGILPQTTTPVT